MGMKITKRALVILGVLSVLAGAMLCGLLHRHVTTNVADVAQSGTKTGPELYAEGELHAYQDSRSHSYTSSEYAAKIEFLKRKLKSLK